MKKWWLLLLIVGVYSRSECQTINLAKGKPVVVNPVIPENKPSYLVDGDDETVFYTYPTSLETRMEVDLQGEYAVDRVLLRGFRGDDSLQLYAVNQEGKANLAFQGVLPAQKLISFEPQKMRKLIVTYTPKHNTAMGELEVYAYEPQPVMVNQSGYNTQAVKRFTAPLATDGTPFQVVKAGQQESLYQGTIHGQVGDFTDFNPPGTAEYQIMVNGQTVGKSFPFFIAPYLIERVSYMPALQFMIDDRCWYGNTSLYKPTTENAGCPFLGVAWRDSHQFSFELQALINLYFSNPDAFSIARMPVEGHYEGLREKLPDETPEIVRLIYYAVDIYLRGKVNHTLLKEQLAYFLYAYPMLKQYIPENVYQEARDYLFAIWGDTTNNRWRWHDIDHNANLLQTYTLIGTGKGQFPPGHSIAPNLMLYEVAKREGRDDAKKYWDAAYKQTEWIIAHLDWQDPATTKGQRMNEYVTLQNLGYFLQQYPTVCPKGLANKIADWAKVIIPRGNNLWDFRKYSSSKWVIPDIKPSSDPTFNPNGSFNEPGNIAGFPAAALMAKELIPDKQLQHQLEILAVGQIDNVFGRNPANRHHSYDALSDFEGADLPWFQELEGGAGMLQTVRGVLDGSPKEEMYPYKPYGGDPGHTEGWVTFNTAWIEGIAYRNYDLTHLDVMDEQFQQPIKQVKPSASIGLRLAAPLNLDASTKEKATVAVAKNGNAIGTVDMEEEGTDGLYFNSLVKLDQLTDLKKGDVLTFAYGLGAFARKATVTIR
ncbi:hypothetical protein GCM10023231_03390 [Olivibacter ginsenosidimutans]|uniref:Cellulase Ig-like domain-containing protein n=1 Tax=Olivibacter ginsenosidimutans TaxID=1176537 RepID=A0ABP9AFJ5_9SPHI